MKQLKEGIRDALFAFALVGSAFLIGFKLWFLINFVVTLYRRGAFE